MKIPPYQTNVAGTSGAADPTTGAATSKTTTTSGATSDTVQLSQNYKDLANAQKSISGTDEVRTDKVEQVQNQLQNGTYQVDAGAIAGQMMGEIM